VISFEPAPWRVLRSPCPTPFWASRAIHARRQSLPLVIASGNGNRSRDADGRTCVEKAFAMMMSGDDVLDALIAGVNIVELDPTDTSVGFGGLPNGDGVVQLDASVMHGPKRRAGAVASLEGVRTPSLVAKAVMEHTDHHLLVGAGAQQFARQLGFEIEDDLNTEESRRLWLEWKRRTDAARWLDPVRRMEAGMAAGHDMVADGLIDPDHFYGTINCNGVNARARSVVSRRPAGWPGRYRAAWATHRSWVPASTSTTKSALPVRPAAARRTSTTCARS
jgi:N4-(beta-N-acetylglucosaminyl)-L-asparaginase